ncbi:MAG: substrate-binding domain-containing protein, partial [Pygmaiobacter sp.]
EKNLGATIFERKNGALQLTCAGERYVSTVRQMLLLEHNLENEIDEIKRECGGSLRFGIPVHHSLMVLPYVLPAFQHEYPLVRLEITEKGSADLSHMIAEGLLDMALVRSVTREKDVIYIQLQEERMGLLAGKDSGIYQKYPNMTELDLAQAADEKFVYMRRGHSSRSTQDKLTEKSNLQLPMMLELDSFETAREVAVRCGGVMVAPSTVLERDKTLQKRAHFYPLKDADNEQNTFLVYHKNIYLTKYMQSWAELLKKAYTTNT